MKVQDYPKALYIELTSRCNLKCKMCRPEEKLGQDMERSLFQDIADDLFQHATFVDLRGWGESTILPNLIDFIDITKEKCNNVKLISNGTIENDILWFHLGLRCVIVGFSVDSSSCKNFKIFRGHGDLNQLLHNLLMFRSGIIQSKRKPEDYIYFLTTVHAKNFHELPDIVLLGQRHGVKNFKLHMISISEQSELSMKHVSIQKMNKVLCELGEISRKMKLTISLNTTLHPDIKIEQRSFHLCIHPWYYLYISAQGNLGFCDHLIGRRKYTFGNWQDGFESFWKGEHMKRIRADHEDRIKTGSKLLLYEECEYCYSNRYVDYEFLIDPNYSNYINFI